MLLLPALAGMLVMPAAAVDGISFDGLSSVDAAAFSIERADKDGDRIYQFTEKSGTHAREIVVVPGDGLEAEAAEVRYEYFSVCFYICDPGSDHEVHG